MSKGKETEMRMVGLGSTDYFDQKRDFYIGCYIAEGVDRNLILEEFEYQASLDCH